MASIYECCAQQQNIKIHYKNYCGNNELILIILKVKNLIYREEK